MYIMYIMVLKENKNNLKAFLFEFFKIYNTIKVNPFQYYILKEKALYFE